MKKQILLLCLLFLITNSIKAQKNCCEPKDTTKNWALQFQVNDLLKFSSFNGSVISLSRKLSEDYSIRFGLSLNFDDRNNELGQIEENNNNEYKEQYESEDNNCDIQFSLNSFLIQTLVANNKTKIFIGYGPQISYRKNISDRKTTREYSTQTESYIVERENSITRYSFGLSGLFGAEWFFMDNYSLSLEYNVQLYYLIEEKSEKQKSYSLPSEDIQINNVLHEMKSNGIKFNANNVKLGLSIYF